MKIPTDHNIKYCMHQTCDIYNWGLWTPVLTKGPCIYGLKLYLTWLKLDNMTLNVDRLLL